MAAAEEVIETVAEEAIDIVEQATREGNAVQLVLVGVLTGSIVGAATYYITKKHLTTKFDQLVKQEVAEAKEFYRVLNKQGDVSTPEKAVEKLVGSVRPPDLDKAVEALQNYQGLPNDPDNEDDEDDSVAVFLKADPAVDHWDIDVEMEYRTPEEPYIISQDEYLEGELDYKQTMVTYYAGDDVVSDDKDQAIPVIDPILGDDNLQAFGHGSGDSRVVYIRNERLSTDFQVLLSDGKYAHEVLGFEHSGGGARGHQRRHELRKFKDDKYERLS